MIKESNTGFTLVELMIILFVISILLTIAAYSYIKSNSTAKKTICMANLRELDTAVDQWVIENNISVGTSMSGSEEEIYDDYERGSRPKCPAGGGYIFGTVGVSPQVTCSKESEGHKLP